MKVIARNYRGNASFLTAARRSSRQTVTPLCCYFCRAIFKFPSCRIERTRTRLQIANSDGRTGIRQRFFSSFSPFPRIGRLSLSIDRESRSLNTRRDTVAAAFLSPFFPSLRTPRSSRRLSRETRSRGRPAEGRGKSRKRKNAASHATTWNLSSTIHTNMPQFSPSFSLSLFVFNLVSITWSHGVSPSRGSSIALFVHASLFKRRYPNKRFVSCV